MRKVKEAAKTFKGKEGMGGGRKHLPFHQLLHHLDNIINVLGCPWVMAGRHNIQCLQVLKKDLSVFLR